MPITSRDQLLTTAQAARILGVTPGRIRQLIVEGRLPARKVGRDLAIWESDLDQVKIRPWGRPYPPKPATLS